MGLAARKVSSGRRRTTLNLPARKSGSESDGRYPWYAIADQNHRSWGVYNDWRQVAEHRPRVYKGFHTRQAARDWLWRQRDTPRPEQQSAKDKAVKPAKRYAWYAIADPGKPSWGVYSRWSDVVAHQPNNYKGFDSEREAKDWLWWQDDLEGADHTTTVESRKAGQDHRWYAIADHHLESWGIYDGWEAAAMQLKARGQAVDNRFYKAIRSSGRGLLSKVEQLKDSLELVLGKKTEK